MPTRYSTTERTSNDHGPTYQAHACKECGTQSTLSRSLHATIRGDATQSETEIEPIECPCKWNTAQETNIPQRHTAPKPTIEETRMVQCRCPSRDPTYRNASITTHVFFRTNCSSSKANSPQTHTMQATRINLRVQTKPRQTRKLDFKRTSQIRHKKSR